MMTSELKMDTCAIQPILLLGSWLIISGWNLLVNQEILGWHCQQMVLIHIAL
ncbi:hypothetical protein RchiOBHm_Chr3g0494451 [Rosa chinensis]|uniref:Uncharacterized protein n=1 Tax=Rosa chinensis TaxID=74649 RepID=A0A2P6RGZ5_ROSCH|nr:hypothetical protein RchiOBHm_Chr3g0494451 [Rosa chinensis]